ncbi:MAG: type IX secretion system membrane protein PorP/SprF [Flavobacteriales bacterium]|nr:type IX secretion system membrane protein PorP/SprF [Flavobacteriales bacterium]MBL0127044.1 type IX secretion system membrane protein PorP/SprF [Flavobacteriales bacterium]
MRGIITAALCAAVASASFAQQDPQFTQYMFDRLSINPGVAGTTGELCGTMLLRQQWTGFDGAPKTALLNVHGSIKRISSGVGLSVFLDKLGQQKSTYARLSYSFHRKIGPGTIGIGLAAGLMSHTLGNDWQATDPISQDNSIPANGNSDMGWDLAAGLYYVSPTLWAGFSSTHLTEVELSNVSIQQRRHYFLQAGYNWKLKGDPKYVVQPSVLMKSDGTSTQFDITGTFLYNNMVWLGVSYRTEDAIAPLIGYQFKPNTKSMLKVGYSYDITTSKLRNYSSGSHELMVNYCVLLVKPPDVQIYRNPLFL